MTSVRRRSPAATSTDRKNASIEARRKFSDSNSGWYGLRQLRTGAIRSRRRPSRPPSSTASSKVMGMNAGGACGGRLPMLMGKSTHVHEVHHRVGDERAGDARRQQDDGRDLRPPEAQRRPRCRAPDTGCGCRGPSSPSPASCACPRAAPRASANSASDEALRGRSLPCVRWLISASSAPAGMRPVVGLVLQLVAQLLDLGDRHRGHELQEQQEQRREQADGAGEQADVDPGRARRCPSWTGRKSRCSEVTTMSKRSHHMPTLISSEATQTIDQVGARPS